LLLGSDKILIVVNWGENKKESNNLFTKKKIENTTHDKRASMVLFLPEVEILINWCWFCVLFNNKWVNIIPIESLNQKEAKKKKKKDEFSLKKKEEKLLWVGFAALFSSVLVNIWIEK
jgi:hypothetical protein